MKWLNLGVWLAFLAAVCPASGDWPQAAGPNYTGVAEGTGFPLYWSRGDGVAWTNSLSGSAISQPIVSGSVVYLGTWSGVGQKAQVCAMDQRNGRTLWTRAVGPERDELPDLLLFAREGQLVLLENGSKLSAITTTGKNLWERDLASEMADAALLHPGKVQAVFYQGRVMVTFPPRSGGLRLLALDEKTGKQVWKRELEGGAVAMSPWVRKHPEQLLIVTGVNALALRVKDGRELWTGSMSPLAVGPKELKRISVDGEGNVFAWAGTQFIAARLQEAGNTVALEKLWSKDSSDAEAEAEVMTWGKQAIKLQPAAGEMECLQIANGNTQWKLKLPSLGWQGSRLQLGGDHIYCVSQSGEVAVIDARSGRMLSRTPMRTGSVARGTTGLALSGGQLFVCDGQRLYCVSGTKIANRTPDFVPGARVGDPNPAKRRLPL